MIWDRAESISLLMDSNHVDDGLEPDGKEGGGKGRVVGNQRLAMVFLMLPGALHVFFFFFPPCLWKNKVVSADSIAHKS